MTSDDRSMQVDGSIPVEAREMDEQFLSAGAARDYEELRTLIVSLPGLDFVRHAEDLEVKNTALAWQRQLLESFPFEPRRIAVEEAPRTYTDHNLTSTADGRTYRLLLRLDNDFGTLADRVVDCTQAGLDRVTAGQTSCFIETAKKHGLTWRRKVGMTFPHPLPYLDPQPTTNIGRYTEEAAIIAAAFHFPFARPAPAVHLTIDRHDVAPNGNKWVLGSADVNWYADNLAFLIKLNGRAIRDATFTDDTWAATIIHEMMHNLGWGHPFGSYNISMAIENYEACIRGAERIETPDNLYPIR